MGYRLWRSLLFFLRDSRHRQTLVSLCLSSQWLLRTCFGENERWREKSTLVWYWWPCGLEGTNGQSKQSSKEGACTPKNCRASTHCAFQEEHNPSTYFFEAFTFMISPYYLQMQWGFSCASFPVVYFPYRLIPKKIDMELLQHHKLEAKRFTSLSCFLFLPCGVSFSDCFPSLPLCAFPLLLHLCC